MSTINRNNRLMHKVAPILRLDKSSRDVFDPFLVSIGPYHHGKPELQLVEKLKPRAVQLFVEGSNNKDKEFYLNKILEHITDVRSCYIEGSTDKYDDAYLANMMLQDACFILKHDEISRDPATIYQVGRFLFEYIFHDIVLLENQIPLSILKLLNYSTSDGNDGTLLDNYINTYIDSDWSQLKLKLGPNDEPIHLLELARRIYYLPEDKSILRQSKSSQPKLVAWVISKLRKSLLRKSDKADNNRDEVVDKDIEEHWCDCSFRSAMDLKSRGVHFKASTSGWYRLEDTKFKSTYFYGELQLPKWNVTIFTKVYLSNMLALENYLSGDECVVTAYVNIMKILLQSTKDVRELREKQVLLNQLRTDGDILQVFLDLPVTTWDTLPPFSDVLEELAMYYRRHTNKWAAELIQTYFRSPWTTIALFAAALLLCLSIIQTCFTVHPASPPSCQPTILPGQHDMHA